MKSKALQKYNEVNMECIKFYDDVAARKLKDGLYQIETAELEKYTTIFFIYL